ncbi:MAG: cation:proton antiporter [Imperialibacter sp.]|uniref:cation:proton antiporter domain-containing protein n=1 Tax=Imperialibacter sp. TaxID=2038411 RepID=UPI0032EC5542
MENSINYLPLFIIMVVAWLVPMALTWGRVTKIPAVIVEIIVGVIIGPYVLDWIEETPYMRFLAYSGFLFLIFLSGLEIDLGEIYRSIPKKIRKIDLVSNSMLLAITIYTGSLLFAIPFSLLLHFFFNTDIVFFSMLLPTVALSVIVPIIKADGELSRKFGKIILMVGAIATIMSIILISIYSGILKNGFESELLLFLVIFVVFFVAYKAGRWLIGIRTFQKLLYTLEHAASQIRIRGTVALLLSFVVVAYLIKTELVLGAFFAGSLLSMFLNKQRSALMFKLDGMSYGFFIPIFFVMVGVNLDISALSEFQRSIPLTLSILAGFFITQVLPAFAMAKIFGWKKALSGGLLLSSRMGLSIATAQIGLSLGVISQSTNSGIVAASILASVLAPMLYKLLHSEGEVNFNLYLFGGSKASLLLAERLKLHGLNLFTVVTTAEDVEALKEKGIQAAYVPNLDTYYLRKLKIRPTDQVVILTDSFAMNKNLALFLEQELNHKKTITLTKDKHSTLFSETSGVKLVNIEDTLASHVENLIMRPDSYQAFSESFGLYRVEEILMSNSQHDREKVKKIAFPPSGSLVMFRRNNEIFIPHGDTQLLLGDVITVIGNTQALEEFRNKLE